MSEQDYLLSIHYYCRRVASSHKFKILLDSFRETMLIVGTILCTKPKLIKRIGIDKWIDKISLKQLYKIVQTSIAILHTALPHLEYALTKRSPFM